MSFVANAEEKTERNGIKETPSSICTWHHVDGAQMIMTLFVACQFKLHSMFKFMSRGQPKPGNLQQRQSYSKI